MSEDSRISWVPWRRPSPVRWTLALALSAFAVIAAAVSAEPSTPLATWAALLALFLAAWASWASQPQRPFVWPWRGPDPLRSTVAFVSMLMAATVLLWGRGASWTPAAFATLLFASAVASPRRGWLDRLSWGFLAALSWWLWYGWSHAR